ncbi:creatininase family protein [Micromonospora sp. WMMD1082]|uniref:creatininase family protein n=1 Tax=Micromonospora sp. WMMD1082 TaxID=3016104 RepID=UPI002416FB75|nr:creatininase family protein [Micromonospora sp. WMMD1082]MDG4795168.1 creatininase family protein [Micromonospora sp. WMMD1082]
MDVLPTTTSADVAAQAPTVAVLPIGSWEQHGSFLPLATDTIVATAITAAIAQRHNVLVLPPITMSCSHEHTGWPGTVSISHQTLSATVEDIRASLAASGVTRLAIVNGHGGNYVLSNIVQAANATAPKSMTLFPTRSDWTKARDAARLDTDTHQDMHGGELEVSILLHVCPHAVGADFVDADHLANDRPMLLVHGLAPYTKTGIIGRPSAGTADKGQALLESLARSFDDHLAIFLHAR